MTRSEVAEKLHSLGMFRDIPSESSLAALISKNAQVVKIGHAKVELSNGLTVVLESISKKRKVTELDEIFVQDMVCDVDRNLIQCEEDIELTMPYSSMTNALKEKVVRCPTCKQMRYMPDMDECLVCQRRV